jgi:hypothetical protein
VQEVPDDAVLVSGVVCHRLAPLFAQSRYLVAATLLPWLRARADVPHALALGMRLLESCLDVRAVGCGSGAALVLTGS